MNLDYPTWAARPGDVGRLAFVAACMFDAGVIGYLIGGLL